MKLLITTQVYENYGAHEWDGEGECPQYWKAKGGCEYVVKNFKAFKRTGLDESATTTVMVLREQIESNNEYLRETINNWRLVEDDYLTEFEKDQLDYQGRIDYSPKELTL